MSWVQYPLGNRYNLLQLWKIYEIFEETNRVRAKQLRRHLNPWLCHQEEQQSRCQTRTFWTTKNVSPSEQDADKGPSKKKHGRHPTILARWYASESYRTSLSAIGWKEKDTMLCERIALEKHFYVATRAERIQSSKHWNLTLNKERPQHPLDQRPDFAPAKWECKRLHDEHLARTQQDYRTTSKTA